MTRLVSRSLLLFTVALAAISLVMVIARLEAVWRDSAIAQTTGAEAPGLYGIYKVWIGEHLYHSLDENPTTFVFNYLFYFLYGSVARLFVGNAESLPLFTRLLTFASCVAFAALLGLHIWRERVPAARGAFLAAALVSPVLSFFAPFVGWWYLSARPDMMAVGFELIGLLLFLRSIDRIAFASMVATALLLGLAFSMKQTAVFTCVGVLLASHLWKSRSETLVLLSGFLAVALLPYVLLDENYIQHVFVARLNPWRWSQLTAVATEATLLGSPVILPALALAALAMRAKPPNRRLRCLVLVLAVTLLGNLVACSKVGSSRNYFLSSWLVAHVLLLESFRRAFDGDDADGRRRVALVLLPGAVLGCAIGACYFAFPQRFGRLSLVTPGERVELTRLLQEIRASPKPVLVEPSYYALPWNSGQYPSDVFNWVFNHPSEGNSLVVSLEDRIRRRHYRSAFVYADEWAAQLAASGYRETARFGRLRRLELAADPENPGG